MRWWDAVKLLRALGEKAWRNTPPSGPWAAHIKDIPPGIPGLSATARAQLRTFRQRPEA